MVYKKFIKKKGKVFGPYIYESVRKGKKIETKYIGREGGKQKRRVIINTIFLLFLIFFIIFASYKFGISGRSNIYLADSTFRTEEVIDGKLNLGIKGGELIPASAIISVDVAGQHYETTLDNLIANSNLDLQKQSGTFYTEGLALEGSGEGFGLAGKAFVPVDVFFKLRLKNPNIIDVEKNESQIVDKVINSSLVGTNISADESSENISADESSENISIAENISASEETTEPAILVEEPQISENETLSFIEITGAVIKPSDFFNKIFLNRLTIDGRATTISRLTAKVSDKLKDEKYKAKDNLTEIVEEIVNETIESIENITQEPETNVTFDIINETAVNVTEPFLNQTVTNLTSNITANATSNIREIVKKVEEIVDNNNIIIDGVVNSRTSFSYSLNGRAASIVPGSMRTEDGKIASSYLVLRTTAEGEAIVTTNYVKTVNGFGINYTLDKTDLLELDLASLGIKIDIPGNYEINVSLTYGEKIITASTRRISVEAPFIPEENETVINEDITNETLENETIVVLENKTENNAPILLKAIQDIIIQKDKTYSVDLALIFSDPDMDVLAYSYDLSLEQGNSSLLVVFDGNKAVFSGTEAGKYKVKIIASDSNESVESNLFYVEITNESVNHAPIFLKNFENIGINESESHSFNLLDYFYDYDSDNLSFSASPSLNISVEFDSFIARIIPDANFTGRRSLSFSASDGNLSIESNTFTIDILKINKTRYNHAPTLWRNISDIYITKNGNLTLNLLSFFSDEDNDTLTFKSIKADNISIDITDNLAYIYSEYDFKGLRIIYFFANDGIDETVSNAVFINFTETEFNTPPKLVKNISNLTISKNQNESINIGQYFSDEDNDSLSFTMSYTQNISFVVRNNEVILIPEAKFTGSRIVYFNATDGKASVSSNNLSINVLDEWEKRINVTEKLKQHKAVIGQPVRWTKNISLSQASNLTVGLPENASNITVIILNESNKPETLITGAAVAGNGFRNFFSRLFSRGVTGRVSENVNIKENNENNGKDVEINENASEFVIEYDTPAPISTEISISEKEKEIEVSSSIHYTDILTYTQLPSQLKVKDGINLRWLIKKGQNLDGLNLSEKEIEEIESVGFIYKPIEFVAYDTDKDNSYDYIEWITPFTSESNIQKFEVSITVLNAKSFYSAGENWSVKFETAGTADLYIKPVQGTWNSENNNLEFVELRCGKSVSQYEFSDDALIVRDYSCDKKSILTSKILEKGRYKLEFNFGDETAHAENYALEVLDSGTTRNCNEKECSVLISSQNFIEEEEGLWSNFTDAVEMKNSGNNILLDWKDYSLTLEVGLIRNGKQYSASELIDEGIEFEKIIEKHSGNYKWGFKFSNMSYEYSEKNENAYIKISSFTGLKQKDIIVDSENFKIILPDISLDYSDIISQGYILSNDKETILIGDIKGKSEIFIDPQVSSNLSAVEDASVSPGGGPGNLNISFLKFQLNTIPSSAIIKEATLVMSGSTASPLSNINVYVGNCTNISWYETNMNASGFVSAPTQNCLTNGNFTNANNILGVNKYNFNVTDYVNGTWLTGTNEKNLTLFLNTTGETVATGTRVLQTNILPVGLTAGPPVTNAVYFNSSEPNDGLSMPYLNVTYESLVVNNSLWISYINPTDTNASVIQDNSTYINISIQNGTQNISVFGISWNGVNMSLVGESAAVGIWNLEMNGTNEYYGVNATNVTCSFNVDSNNIGVFRNATYCNGSQLIDDAQSIGALNAVDNFTIEAWIKAGVNDGNATIFEEGGATYGMFLDWNGSSTEGLENMITFGARNASGMEDMELVSVTNNLGIGTWHHILGRANGTHLSIFIDGVEVINNASGLSTVPNAGDGWTIGGASVHPRDGSYGYYFNGSIDSVRVWKKSLNESEITNLYKLQFTKYGINMSNLANGTYEYYAWANDTSNNFNRTQKRILYVDLEPPIITILSPLNQTYTTSNIGFNISLNENGSWCGFYMDSQDAAYNISMSTDSNSRNFNYTNFSTPVGSHNVTFICNDTVNNYNSSKLNNVTFNVLTNVAPSAINVTILPNSTTENPYTNSTLNCSFEIYDSDLADNLKINVSWFNGTTYYNSSTFIVLAASRTANGYYNYSLVLGQGGVVVNPQGKNDNWNCSVNVSDASADNLKSNTTQIQNTAPTLSLANFTLSPSTAYPTDVGINCTVGAGDADADTFTYIYLWYKNNVTTAIATQNITNSSFTQGDVLTCQAVISDGTANSAKVNSSNLTISVKAAPNITIISPLNQTYITAIIPYNISLSETGSWCGFYMDSQDATFNTSMSKDSNGLNFNYTNFSTPDGSHNVTFICNDTYNNYNSSKLNNVTFNLNFAPFIDNPLISPLSVNTSDTLNCSTTAYDTDLDTMTINFTWYNGSAYYNSSTKTGIANGTNVSVLLLAAVQGAGETWNCTVFANDGTADGRLNSSTKLITDLIPYFTNIVANPTSVVYGNVVNFSANVEDDGLVTDVIFSHNFDPTLNESENITLTSNTDYAFGLSTYRGQIFKLDRTAYITRACINVSYATGTKEDIIFEIRRTNSQSVNSLPTGTVYATSQNVSSSSVTSSVQQVCANFSDTYLASAGYYALVIKSDASSKSKTYDITATTFDDYANGRLVSSSNYGGTWSGTSSRDLEFLVETSSFNIKNETAIIVNSVSAAVSQLKTPYFALPLPASFNYRWYATDNSGQLGISSLQNYYVRNASTSDTTLPLVQWRLPPDMTYFNGNVQLMVNCTDNVACAAVSFFYKNTTMDWNLLGTASRINAFDWQYYWDTSAIANLAAYDLKAEGLDPANNSNFTSVRTFTIDHTIPRMMNLTVQYPSGQSSVKNESVVILRANATDGSGSGLNYSLADVREINGSGNLTMLVEDGTRQTGTWTVFNLSVIINGTDGLSKPVRTYVFDNATPTSNILDMTYFLVDIDNTAPTSSDCSESFAPVYSGQNLTMTCLFSDNNNLSRYIFSTNQTGSWVNSSIVYFSSDLSEYASVEENETSVANVSWRFYFWDDANNSAVSGIKTFEVNDISSIAYPNIYLLTPENESSVNRLDINFTYNVSDTAASNCTLYIGSIAAASNSTPILLNGNSSIIYTLDTGDFEWNIICKDYVGNENISETRTITAAGVCGDGVCDSSAGETSSNCPVDCVPAGCSDECYAGQRECIAGNSYRTCGNYDADSCLDWSPELQCASGTCSNGVCATCINECSLGSKECINNTSKRECILNTDTSCTVWQTSSCIIGNICTAGNCLSCTESWTCSDYGPCIKHLETRTCTDSNNCGTEFSKPSENRTCNNVLVVNYNPQNLNLIVYSNTQLSFSISATDADNDDISVDWSVNGNLEKQQSGKGSVSSDLIKTITDALFIDAVISDGSSVQTVSWKVSTTLNETSQCTEDWRCDWTECNVNKTIRYSQNCTDFNRCGTSITIPIWEKCSCISNWSCDAWSECEITYSAKNLLDNVNFVAGKQKRLCTDTEGCYSENKKIQNRNCSKTVNIKAECNDWCGEKYLEIYNLDTGSLIGRIKQTISLDEAETGFMTGNIVIEPLEKQKSVITAEVTMAEKEGCVNIKKEASLDIDLSLTNLSSDQCWWCFDKIKDFDEEGVDCGGKYCSPCNVIAIPAFNLLQLAGTFFFILSILLLLIYLVSSVIEKRPLGYKELLGKAFYEEEKDEMIKEIKSGDYRKMLQLAQYEKEKPEIIKDIKSSDYRKLLRKSAFDREKQSVAKDIESSEYQKLLRNIDIKQESKKVAVELAVDEKLLNSKKMRDNLLEQDRIRKEIVKTKNKNEFERLDNKLHQLKKELRRLKSS